VGENVSNNDKPNKKINFSVARKTRRTLLQFYERNPHYIELLTTDPDNSVMWEMIFGHFFGSMPRDPQPRTVPSYYRLGSTDPRWDTLFFNMHGLSLHRKLVRQHARMNLFSHSNREAA
jgi:hypothetical protein